MIDLLGNFIFPLLKFSFYNMSISINDIFDRFIYGELWTSVFEYMKQGMVARSRYMLFLKNARVQLGALETSGLSFCTYHIVICIVPIFHLSSIYLLLISFSGQKTIIACSISIFWAL